MPPSENKEFVGHPAAYVRMRKRSFQYISPPNRDFDLNVSDFAIGQGADGETNFREGNFYYDSSTGAIMVRPLFKRRSNYVVNSATPNEARYETAVPAGAPTETLNERKKRVFRPEPTIFQYWKQNDFGNFTYGDFKYPWEDFPTGYSGPRWIETPPDEDVVGDVKVPVNWIFQEQTHPNVEWFLRQEYGNFTNESFWFDFVKYEIDEEASKDKDAVYDRKNIYGKDTPVGPYLAIRIGWAAEEPLETPVRSTGGGLTLVKPISNSGEFGFLGPFDIVFPIGGTPFIWDHQGDTSEKKADQRNGNKGYYSGYVANYNNDSSWTLKNETGKFRIWVLSIRGKMVIKASYTNTSWVFPLSISSKANSETKRRYENFFIPPGKICLLGRGFSFMFNYNPLEFDIYDGEGNEREPHASITTVPMMEREYYPGGVRGGWEDMKGRGADENPVYTEIPFQRETSNQDNNVYNEEDESAYGFDVVSTQYPDHSGPYCSYTSMMIPVNSKKPKNINRLVKGYFRPPQRDEDLSPTTDANYGFEVESDFKKFTNKYFEIEMNCDAPSFKPEETNISKLYTDNISKRFASPIAWRFKGRHRIVRPSKPEWFNLSNMVKTLDYSTDANNLYLIRQECTVNVFIPKDYQFINDDFGLANKGISSRQEWINYLQDGVKEIEIYLGWANSETEDPALIDDDFMPSDKMVLEEPLIGYTNKLCKYFTGLARSGPIKQTYGEDIISLKCSDKLEILDGYPIINSPIYDGMAVDRAFLNVCKLNGLPGEMFDVISSFAHKHILPLGYTFQDPKIRFESGKTLFDAVQEIAQFFMHVIRTQPDGTIVLTDIYSPSLSRRSNDLSSLYQGSMVVIDDLDTTHPSYKFYVDGSDTNNPFQRIYEDYSYDKNISDQVSQLQIMSVDRTDGAFIMDGSAFDIDSIENPDVDNFIGYSKPLRVEQPAFGDMAHIQHFKKMLSRHVFQSPIRINFSTYGRPTIRPLDIIEVKHSYNLPDMEGAFVDSEAPEDSEDLTNLKFRVVSVNGSVDPTDPKFGYNIRIEAEHL